MSGIGRRRSSKWDKEEISPEIHHDIGRSTKAGSSYHGHESREYTAGRRGFQRDERMNEESMLAWEEDGHYSRRMSPGPDGWRRDSRSRSPRRTRGRSYRSGSRSRSRSPVYNPRREPELDHSNNSKMRQSAPSCRDFASGRCRKGDLCRFAHHGSPNHDTRRHFASRTEDGWESRRRDDGALRRHSETYSTGGRSRPLCNDFMKGRCTRGASCKFRHHDSGSDEFGKGTMDGAYRDRDDDWRGKSGSSYDREPPASSELPMCKFFASGNCRNGNHCKFSHQSEKNAYSDGRHSQHNLDDTNKVWNDSNWGEKASLRGVSDSRKWDVDRNDYMDPGKSRSGEWSKDELANQKVGDSPYTREAPMSGNEKMSHVETQSDQWKANEISISRTKGMEKGFGDGEMPSPTGTFNPQMGLVGERSDSQPFPFLSQSTGEQDTSQRALAENHYVSGMTKQNMPGGYLQSNSSFQVDNGTGNRNSESSYVNTNVPANAPYVQGINQVDGGISAPPITREENVGQTHPTFPSHPLIRDNMQMAQHQVPVDTNLAMGQSQSTFPAHSQSQGLPIPQRQAVDDPKPAGVAYTSSAGVTGLLPSSGATLGQNNALTEQLAQYTHLSATLAQLLEKRQQLPQLYAAITQQSTVGGGSNLPDAAVSAAPASVAVSQPQPSSEQSTQYNPLSDSIETKVINSSKELLPSIGDPIAGPSKDELQRQSHDPNVQGQAVVGKEENGQATGAGTNGTRDNLDQGAAEDAGLDSGADDGKKGKDARVIRSFKFALAEFIKELLKPKWKEGKMSKDVHKTIVKKVVDKVTDTIQADHVPRTKEKIDQYLSSSKPKLNKLVQAYIEKYQKT